MREIHPTAIVDRRAELADDVKIGAFCVIGAGVTLGPGTVVLPQCIIEGITVVGKNARIGPCAFLGLPPQHLKYSGEGASLLIGDDVTIRETATLHRSISAQPGRATRVGNRCYLMAGAHVGHDCSVGDDIILANAVLLGGHVEIGNKAFIGGGATIHQFVRVGRLSIVSGNEAITHDAPPFSAVRYGGLKGYNAIGCKRSGMSREAIHAVRGAFFCLHTNRTLPSAVAAMQRTVPMAAEVREMLDFIAAGKRGILPSVRFRQSQFKPIESADGEIGD